MQDIIDATLLFDFLICNLIKYPISFFFLKK